MCEYTVLSVRSAVDRYRTTYKFNGFSLGLATGGSIISARARTSTFLWINLLKCKKNQICM